MDLAIRTRIQGANTVIELTALSFSIRFWLRTSDDSETASASCRRIVIIISIDSMTSLTNNDAPLPCNQDLFENIILKKRTKVYLVLAYHNHPEVPTLPYTNSGSETKLNQMSRSLIFQQLNVPVCLLAHPYRQVIQLQSETRWTETLDRIRHKVDPDTSGFHAFSDISVSDVAIGCHPLGFSKDRKTETQLFSALEEFESAVRLVLENVSFDTDVDVSVFETNIRILGGLLGAHISALEIQKANSSRMKWYSDELLQMATDIGDRLLPAFNTSTGIPLPIINLRNIWFPFFLLQESTCTACAGTMILEFAALSRLTGNPIYEEKAVRAMAYLWKQRSRYSDLVGRVINVHSGDWVLRDSGIGAGIDSYYEYLLKAYVLLGEPVYLHRFHTHYQAIKRYVSGPESARFPFLFLDVNMHSPSQRSRSFMDALFAFWPGIQVLLGDIKSAVALHEYLFQVHKRNKLMPEAFTPDLRVHWGQHLMRPEFIESTYLLYRATNDPYYLKVGARVVDDLQNYTRVPCGYAAVEDVRTMNLSDRFDSFVLAETFKYLYLLFTEPSDLPFPLGDYVFTTEAHLLPLSLSQVRPKNTSSVFMFDGTHNIESHVPPIEPNDHHGDRDPSAEAKLRRSSIPQLALAGLLFIQELLLLNKVNQQNEEAFVEPRHVVLLNPPSFGRVRFRACPAYFGLFPGESNAATSTVMTGDSQSTTSHTDKGTDEETMKALPTKWRPLVAPVRVAYPLDGCSEVHSEGTAYPSQSLKWDGNSDESAAGATLKDLGTKVGLGPLAGSIGLIRRGGCLFVDKARNLAKAGAVGGIVVDNVDQSSAGVSSLFTMSGEEDPAKNDVDIPFVLLFGKERDHLLDEMRKHWKTTGKPTEVMITKKYDPTVALTAAFNAFKEYQLSSAPPNIPITQFKFHSNVRSSSDVSRLHVYRLPSLASGGLSVTRLPGPSYSCNRRVYENPATCFLDGPTPVGPHWRLALLVGKEELNTYYTPLDGGSPQNIDLWISSLNMTMWRARMRTNQDRLIKRGANTHEYVSPLRTLPDMLVYQCQTGRSLRQVHTKGRDDFSQFIQKYQRFLLFENENDVIRIFQIDDVFIRGHLNTRCKDLHVIGICVAQENFTRFIESVFTSRL
ncbi:ER degradation enhancer mannosidase alpha-like 3 [Clonorchis sinensis]|uniref:alpha-1,2-Mannosidase n=1 Tax=Clonorchis sinensis TaxID=79923 RepID=H2KUB2_CLOSI|nr:ER degradation enhancer mannosidase alpha-like 3 [Clonorchis sinensis]